MTASILPYPGLRAYARDESYLFFGRDACIDEMVDTLSQTRFLAVLGSSGSGKSSLVRTGLLNALDLGLHPAGSDWAIVDMHPGYAPLEGLAEGLLSLGEAIPEQIDVDLMTAFLSRGPMGIAEWTRDGGLPKGRNLLLLVDQFEELFRYQNYADREEAEQFIALLLESSRAADVSIHVVVTMRSEYLGACAQLPGLSEAINAGLYLTRRMTREECREAIEGPAGVAGFTIDPALVTRLLNALASFAPWIDLDQIGHQQAARQADQLPLMQHLLSRLWTRADAAAKGRPIRLTLADYEEIGGVDGALDQHADEIMRRLTPHQRPLVGPVFKSLVSGQQIAEAVRRPRAFADLVALTKGDAASVGAVVDAFRSAGCNFLQPPETQPLTEATVVDISHESLIRQWSRLSKWFLEEAGAARVEGRLSADAEAWAAGDRSRDRLLPTGSWLAEGEDLIAARRSQISPLTIEFVEASAKAQREEQDSKDRDARRRLGLASLVAAVFAGLFLFTLFLLYHLNKANDAAQLAAERAESGFQLAMQATETMAQSAGVDGAKLDKVLNAADGFVAGTSVLLQRASQLLAFAETSSRIGVYDGMRDRISSAQAILDHLCGQTAVPDAGCRRLISESYRLEGERFVNIEELEEAGKSFGRALEIASEQSASSSPFDKARLLALLSQSQRRSSAVLEARRSAEGCLAALATVVPAEAESGKGRLRLADCHIAAGLALVEGEDKRPDEAQSHAGRAREALPRIDLRSVPDVPVVELFAYLSLLESALESDRGAAAAGRLKDAADMVDNVSRTNPQNETVARLLDRLLAHQIAAYDAADRADRATDARERRVELAASRSGGTQAAYWRERRRVSRLDLAQAYEARRPREALQLLERELDDLRIEGDGLSSPKAALSPILLNVLRTAGYYAISAKNGLSAFQHFRTVLNDRENQDAATPPDGERYRAYDNDLLTSLLNLSYVQADMLPRDRKVDILSQVVARIENYEAEEPRVVTLKDARQRALHQLAIAEEDVGDVAESRKAHERAAAAGSQQSMVILRRWYLEGLKGTAVDQDRARALEQASQRQESALIPGNFSIKDRLTGRISSTQVYLTDVNREEALRNEEYRLKRYLNAEIDDSGRNLIEYLYSLADHNKLPIKNLMTKIGEIQRSSKDLPDTVLKLKFDEIERLIAAGNAAGALAQAELLRSKLNVGAPSAISPGEENAAIVRLVDWGRLGETFVAIARLAAEGDTAIASVAERAGREAVDTALSVRIAGSSPRIHFAERLELLGKRADQSRNEDVAERYYRRAIELRTDVRVEDPKNSECSCQIAADYEAISKLHQRQGNIAAAIQTMHQSHSIREELYAIEPNRDWREVVALSALLLAELYEATEDDGMAVRYANRAIAVRQEIADGHGATSQQRQNLAASLETSAKAEERNANSGRKDRIKVTSMLETALDKLDRANQIRRSVLDADPSNAECLCFIGSNLQTMNNIYRMLGRGEDALKALEQSTAIYRALVENQPNNRNWRINFANTLDASASTYRAVNRTEDALKALEQSAHIYRMLVESEPDNRSLRINLARGLNESADIYRAGNRVEDALKALEQSAGIYKTLVENESDKHAWHEILANTFNVSAGMYYALGRAEDALKALEQSAGIYRTLVESKTDNRTWRIHLANTLDESADIYRAGNRAEDALKALEQSAGIYRTLIENEPDSRTWRNNLAGTLNISSTLTKDFVKKIIYRSEARAALQRPESETAMLQGTNFSLSYNLLFAKRFEDAIAAAEQAVILGIDDFERIWPLSNKAHALMFLGRREEAMDLYRKHADAIVKNRKFSEDILNDFRAFREAGLLHPMMEDVSALMEAAKAMVRNP